MAAPGDDVNRVGLLADMKAALNQNRRGNLADVSIGDAFDALMSAGSRKCDLALTAVGRNSLSLSYRWKAGTSTVVVTAQASQSAPPRLDRRLQVGCVDADHLRIAAVAFAAFGLQYCRHS